MEKKFNALHDAGRLGVGTVCGRRARRRQQTRRTIRIGHAGRVRRKASVGAVVGAVVPEIATDFRDTVGTEEMLDCPSPEPQFGNGHTKPGLRGTGHHVCVSE